VRQAADQRIDDKGAPDARLAANEERQMKELSELDAIRQQGILSSLAGFPILIVFAFVWTAAGVLSYLLPPGIAPWVYVFLGAPAMPVAIMLELRLGYVPAPKPDPLFPLAIQLLFVQVVAFPAILLVWSAEPEFMPVAFAAIVGAHFLPYHWVYQTRIYTILGVTVATGPYILAALFDEQSMHYTGFFVGAVLLIGALSVRAHARRVWLESQTAQREPVHR